MQQVGTVVKISYAGADRGMSARVVGEWKRGQVHMVMSASSGPKDYVKNLMCAVLDAGKIDEILMLCGEFKTSVPFCIFRVGSRWFDCSLITKDAQPRQVVIR